MISGCKFEVTMAVDCLVQHCISVHGWKVYSCPYDYCKYEAYSQRSYKENIKTIIILVSLLVNFKRELRTPQFTLLCGAYMKIPWRLVRFEILLKMHTASHKTVGKLRGSIDFSCDRGNCGKRFNCQSELKEHLKIHDNIVHKCHFCPWTGVQSQTLVDHLNHHFEIRPFPCRFCEKKFFVSSERLSHERIIHEKIQHVHKCGSCDFKTIKLKEYRAHLESCKIRKSWM